MASDLEDYQDQVIKLKREFLEEAAKDSHLYDDEDIERIKLEDWFTKRYLMHCQGNYTDALKMLRTSMRWRKSFGVNSLKETDFPEEYFLSGIFFTYAPDKKGNCMLYIRGKLHRQVYGWSELNKRFFVFIIDQLERRMGGHHYAAFWDCKGTSLCNVDTDLLFFMLSTITNYFPYGLEYVLIVDLPMALTALYNLAKRWVPEHYQRLVIITSRDKKTDYIDSANLPRYLGGRNQISENTVPSGVLSARELEKRYKLPGDAALRLEQHLRTVLYHY